MSVGAVGEFENVQVITSPACGVTVKLAPAPLGSTVAEPAVLFEQLPRLRHSCRAVGRKAHTSHGQVEQFADIRLVVDHQHSCQLAARAPLRLA